MWDRKVLIILLSLAGLGLICASYFYFFHSSESEVVAIAEPEIEQVCPADVRACQKSNRLYHRESKRCFEKDDTPSVCGRHMAIWPVPSCKIQGYCECDYDTHDRLLIYHPETKQCYFIYDQGPCPEGQVLVLPENRNGTANCEPDICLAEKKNVPSHDLMFVPYQSKCYHLYLKLNKPGCKGELRFWKNQAKPSCQPFDKSSLTITPDGVLHSGPAKPCLPGSVQFYERDCGNYELLADYE